MANKITKIPNAKINSKKVKSINDQYLSEVLISANYNEECYLVEKKGDKKYVLDIFGADPVETVDTSKIKYVMHPVANKVFKGIIASYQAELQQYIYLLTQYAQQIPIDTAINFLPFSDDTADTEQWKGFSSTWYIFSLETIGVFERRASASTIMGMSYLKLTDTNDGSGNFNFKALQIDADFVNSDVFKNLQRQFKKVAVETSLGTGYVLYDGIGPDVEYKQIITDTGSYTRFNLFNNGQPIAVHRISFDSLDEIKLSTSKYEYNTLIPSNPEYPTSNPFVAGDFAIIGDPEHFKVDPMWTDSSNTIYIGNISSYECDLNTMPTEENPHGYIQLVKIIITDDSTCLAGDTLIRMADNTYRRIDQINQNDLVWTLAGPETVIYTDAAAHKVAAKYIEYSLSNGASLKVINSHRFYSPAKKKFIKSTKLKVGDKLLTDNNILVKITAITEVIQNINHYTLVTSGCNKYSANGILTGNRASNIHCSWLRKLYTKFYLYWIRRKKHGFIKK